MKILFCDYLKATNPDGQSTHIHEVLSGLAKIGHNVVSLSGGCVRGDGEVDTGMRPSLWTRIKSTVFESRMLRPIIGEITILWWFLRETYVFLSAFVVLAKRKVRFDAIYRRHGLFNSEYLLAKLFSIPTVKEVNGILADEKKIIKKGNRISLWIFGWIERFNMPKADAIIVVTPKLKELLQSDYGIETGRIAVIQNGVNTDLFKPIDITMAREELYLRGDYNYICFVGILVEWQGIEYVIEGMPLILGECPQTQLVIVGYGQMRPELIELAEQVGVSDNVIFTGMVPYQKVPLYINASDVCVAPKVGLRSGYSPLKLCEYMACGKPVVASRASGLEILEDCQSGILVEPKDAAGLAAAIIKLLKNQELRKQMGENGRRYVVQNQSWESVAKRVADVCQSLVDRRSRRGEQ